MRNILYLLVVLFSVGLPILLGIGWINNLIRFTKLDFKEPYKAEIIRGVGLTPIGGIIGLINVKDN